MAHHHQRNNQSGTYPPPLFVAELDATQPDRIFSPEGKPVFEMSGDQVPTQQRVDAMNAMKARPERQETNPPTQANPWPFYLDDEGRKQPVPAPEEKKEQAMNNQAPGRYDGEGYPDEYGEADGADDEPPQPSSAKRNDTKSKESDVPAALAINFTGHSAVSNLSADSRPVAATPVSPTHTGSTSSYVPAALRPAQHSPQPSQTVQSPVSPKQYKAYHPSSPESEKNSPTQPHHGANVPAETHGQAGVPLAYRPYRRPSYEQQPKPDPEPALAAAPVAVAVAAHASSPAPATATTQASTPEPVAMHSVAGSPASPPPVEPTQPPYLVGTIQTPYPSETVQPPYPSEPIQSAQPPYPEGVAPHHFNAPMPPPVPVGTRPTEVETARPAEASSSSGTQVTSSVTSPLHAPGPSHSQTGPSATSPPPAAAEVVLWPHQAPSSQPTAVEPQANVASPASATMQPQAQAPVSVPSPTPTSPPAPAPAPAPAPVSVYAAVPTPSPVTAPTIVPTQIPDPTPIPVHTPAPETTPIPPSGHTSPPAPAFVGSPPPSLGSPAPIQLAPTPGYVPQPTYSTEQTSTDSKPSRFPQFQGTDQIPIQDPPPPYVPPPTHGAGSYSVPSEKPSLFPPPPQAGPQLPQSQYPTQPTYAGSNSQPVSGQPSPHATPSPYGQAFPQPHGTPSPYGQPLPNVQPGSFAPSPIQGVNAPPSPYAPSPIQGTNTPPGPYAQPFPQGQPIQYAQPQGPPPPQAPPGPYGYAPPVGQPYYAEGAPPLPPRPSTAQGSIPTMGFSSNPINPVAYPPPPKTHYIPPPPNSTLPNYQRPGGGRIFGSSVAGKWLGKANQVLENKIEGILQNHPDPKYRPQQQQTQQYPPGAFYTNNTHAPPQQGQWQPPQQPQYSQNQGPPPF